MLNILNKLRFSSIELKELSISTIILGCIFSPVFGFNLRGSLNPLIIGIVIAIVGLSFIPHELAHKFTSIHFGSFAEYRMWKGGLLFGAILAAVVFFTGGGIIFAAPGAVRIHVGYDLRGRLKTTGSRETALISAAGPLTNIIIAAVGMTLMKIFALSGFAGVLIFQITYINALLAFFNLLPIPPFDGSKIIRYNIFLWLVLIATAGILFFSL